MVATHPSVVVPIHESGGPAVDDDPILSSMKLLTMIQQTFIPPLGPYVNDCTRLFTPKSHASTVGVIIS